MRDPYSVLGVPRNADADAIRKAYKKLARQWHPDVNKSSGAEERFKQINAAYDILGDETKRANFDRYGEASTRAGFDPRQAGGFGGGMGGFDFGGGVDVDDLLGSLFGAGGRSGPRRGRDQTLELHVDFMTVVLGGRPKVSVRRPDGRAESLDVPIPAGASDGGKVRLRGQGLPPRGGGPCGDLLVKLSVRPHPVLRRDGDDLEMDVPITVLEALQGASITVPTPTGDVKLKVPAGASSGTRMRIRGRGVQRKGRPGDLYLVLRPEVPATASDEVLAAARALEEAYDGDVRGELRL
jgi:DnaJ-class molecular chaperone